MVADGQLVVPGRDGAVLFEPGDRPLDHVALAVAHRIHLGWPAAPRSAAGPSLLLVGPLRDGVGDPPLTQQRPHQALAELGESLVLWRRLGRPRNEARTLTSLGDARAMVGVRP